MSEQREYGSVALMRANPARGVIVQLAEAAANQCIGMGGTQLRFDLVQQCEGDGDGVYLIARWLAP